MQAPKQAPATGLQTLWQRHPVALSAVILVLAGLIAVNTVLLANHRRYRSEVVRLREGMTDTERRRADLVLASETHRLRVALELVRRRARRDRELHLAVAVDSGKMYLERDGVVLREMSVRFGPSRIAGIPTDTTHLVTPRGTRTVTRILSSGDSWNVPAWVYADLGLTTPDSRRVSGALGPVGILLSGGTVVYARPTNGPLADSAYVLPGSVQADAADLRAIAPNITPGMKIYFF